MGSSHLVGVINAAYTASLAPQALAFQRDLRAPAKRQAQLLKAFLNANANTAYGRHYRYERVRHVRDFQDQVPIVDYDALSPWIDRATNGEPHVFTQEPLVIFERSSGSSSGNKLIPYTAGLLSAFGRATSPWLFDLYSHTPGLLGGRSYWSVSPVAQQRSTTAGGTPIGFEDDTAYFGPLARWALGQTLAVPQNVARVVDVDAWRQQTAIALLAAADLALISVWSPSFLTLLLTYIEANATQLTQQLKPKRAAFIQHALQQDGRLVAKRIWPRLQLLSCWTDGHAKAALPALLRYCEGVEVQGKGLLATEGVVSLPLLGVQAPVAAVSSHFLEFIDLESPTQTPQLVHELEHGKTYSPLLTTPGGFARYHLKDVVECVGYHHQTPLLRFAGKLDRHSDLAGEKLTATQVEQALAQAAQQANVHCTFALLAPATKPTLRYTLFVETAASNSQLVALELALENLLLNSYHYKYCRELGQLHPVVCQRVEHGWERFTKAQLSRGLRLGDIKPTPLDSWLGWHEAMRLPLKASH